METRLIIAYALIALMASLVISLWLCCFESEPPNCVAMPGRAPALDVTLYKTKHLI